MLRNHCTTCNEPSHGQELCFDCWLTTRDANPDGSRVRRDLERATTEALAEDAHDAKRRGEL